VSSSELLKRVAELEEQLARALAENEALRKEQVELRKALEEWKRGFRERSKRRSSRAEGRMKDKVKKRPGRKRGHVGAKRTVPDADRTVEYPMPGRCDCGGCVGATGEVKRMLVQDIPQVKVENVEHVTPIGRCQRCGRPVVARLPGTPEVGTSIAETQVGPNAQAMVVSLRFEHRMPLGQISRFLDIWFGLSITAGGIHHLLTRLRERSAPSYEEIALHVRSASVVNMDETGLRQDGVGGWAWIARTEEVSLFRVELSRGAWVAKAMLGGDFRGVVCSDFYGVYTAEEGWAHGYCGAHMIREAKKVAEVNPNVSTEKFRDVVCDWYERAKRSQKNGTRAARASLREELDKFVTSQSTDDDPEVLRLSARIDHHFEGVTLFLDRRSVPADNNAAERDLRPIAVFRKVTGGTRSTSGSQNLAHWMSVTQTLDKNGVPVRDYVRNLWDSNLQQRPPPSVFAPD
jgi:hypothetical protein